MLSEDRKTTKEINEYNNEIQKFIIQEDTGKLSLADRLRYVHQYMERYKETPNLNFFFQGEEAFHKGSYREALRLYRLVEDIPETAFFCCRATAHALKKNGQFSEAMSFAKKALEQNDTDFLSIKFMLQMLEATNQSKDKEYWESKKLDLQKAFTNTQTNSASKENTPTLEKKKINLQDLVFLPANKKHPLHTKTSFSYSISDLFKPSKASKKPTSLASTSEDILEEIRSIGLDRLHKTSSELLEEELGLSIFNISLPQSIQSHLKYQQHQLSLYTERSYTATFPIEDFVHTLQGWDSTLLDTIPNSLSTSQFLKKHSLTQGGVFIRWKGKGIVINPGPNFLNNFHEAGYFVNAIDYVIVTRSEPCYYEDLDAIHSLNYQRNTLAESLHVISYYLNPSAYRELSSKLHPRFKEERNTVNCLEVFYHSPELETIQLSDEHKFSYFANQKDESDCQIGLRFELSDGDYTQIVSYLSGLPWNSIFTSHLRESALVIGAFENTHLDDVNKVKFNTDSLGFNGSSTLIEELSPKLFITCEFSGKEGDIRMDVAKKLREEIAYSKQGSTNVLPADKTLLLNLRNLQVRCSINKNFVSSGQIQVVKAQKHFSSLQFISPSSLI